MKKMIKKLFAAAMISTAMLSSMAMPAFANDGCGIDAMPNRTCIEMDHMSTTICDTNVRTQPSENGDIITTLPAGTTVEVGGVVLSTVDKSDTSWRKVYVTDPVYGGITSGYVYGPVCLGEGANNSYSSGTACGFQVNAYYKTVTGTTNYLAVRTAPVYDDSNEICKLHNGDVVTVLGTGYGNSGNYVYIQTGSGVLGFVNGNFLS